MFENVGATGTPIHVQDAGTTVDKREDGTHILDSVGGICSKQSEEIAGVMLFVDSLVQLSIYLKRYGKFHSEA